MKKFRKCTQKRRDEIPREPNRDTNGTNDRKMCYTSVLISLTRGSGCKMRSVSFALQSSSNCENELPDEEEGKTNDEINLEA